MEPWPPSPGANLMVYSLGAKCAVNTVGSQWPVTASKAIWRIWSAVSRKSVNTVPSRSLVQPSKW